MIGEGDSRCCRDRDPCGRRHRQLGLWIGVRVLRRRDRDGTEWTIRPTVKSTLTPHLPPYTLTMRYRDHRAVSHHDSPDTAKRHVDDLLASWQARSLSDYRERRR